MYCSTCELEIKGENKQQCPICGSSLAENPYEGSAIADPDQKEQAKLQEMIEDINSLVSQQDTPMPDEGSAKESHPVPEGGAGDEQQVPGFAEGSAEEQQPPGSEGASVDEQQLPGFSLESDDEQVFVLRDYDSDLEAAAQQDDSGERIDTPQPDELSIDLPHAHAPDSSDTDTDHSDDEPLRAVIDSIRHSLNDEERTAPDAAAAHEDADSTADEQEACAFSDTIDMAPADADFLASDTDAADEAGVGYDATRAAERRDARKRTPVVAVVLIVVVLGAGGYYAMTRLSGDPGRQVQVQTALQPESLPGVLEPEKPAETVTAAPVAAEPDPIAPIVPEPMPELEPPAEPAVVAEPVSKPVEVAAPVLPTPAPVRVAEPPPERIAPISAPFYTVHAGSYRRQQTAASEVDRIKKAGHDAFVERADLGQRGIWFRVKVGRFKTKAEAEALQSRIQPSFVSDSRVVLNR